MTRPLILFAPGAGAPSSSEWMKAWTARLAAIGSVTPFDYPYQTEGKRRPDPLPVLIAAHRAALASATRSGAETVVLAGKSMGSRVGCHASLEEPVSGLVCFGYPLRGAGKNGKLRDEVLVALRTPILFVSGTRDELCPLDELAAVRERMTAPSTLHVVEGGDHSLLPLKTALRAAGKTQEDVDAEILAAVTAFVAGLEPRR